MSPKLLWAGAFPCSAAFRYQATACQSSSGTPSPLAYMIPRLNWAGANPCSAAFRYQNTACRSSSGTPSPLAYMDPSLVCARASPCSAPCLNPAHSGCVVARSYASSASIPPTLHQAPRRGLHRRPSGPVPPVPRPSSASRSSVSLRSDPRPRRAHGRLPPPENRESRSVLCRAPPLRERHRHGETMMETNAQMPVVKHRPARQRPVRAHPRIRPSPCTASPICWRPRRPTRAPARSPRRTRRTTRAPRRSGRPLHSGSPLRTSRSGR